MTQTPKNDMQVVKGLKQLANAPTTLGAHTSNSRELESTPTLSGTDEEPADNVLFWESMFGDLVRVTAFGRTIDYKEFCRRLKARDTQRDKAIEAKEAIYQLEWALEHYKDPTFENDVKILIGHYQKENTNG